MRDNTQTDMFTHTHTFLLVLKVASCTWYWWFILRFSAARLCTDVEYERKWIRMRVADDRKTNTHLNLLMKTQDLCLALSSAYGICWAAAGRTAALRHDACHLNRLQSFISLVNLIVVLLSQLFSLVYLKFHVLPCHQSKVRKSFDKHL